MMNNTVLTGEYLTVSEVKNYLKISQSAAYGLTHSKGFPVCRLGGTIRIPRAAFLAWLEQKSSIPAHLREYMNMAREAS